MSGVRPRAAGQFRTRTPMSGYLVSGRHGSEAERSDGSGKWSEAVCMVRIGCSRGRVRKDGRTDARSDSDRSCGSRDVCRFASGAHTVAALSVRAMKPGRKSASAGRVPPAGLSRPDSPARTFSPDAPFRTFLSYSFRRSFCIRFSRSIAIPKTNPCRGFSFCPFFSYIRLKDNRSYC